MTVQVVPGPFVYKCQTRLYDSAGFSRALLFTNVRD